MHFKDKKPLFLKEITLLIEQRANLLRENFMKNFKKAIKLTNMLFRN